MAKKFGQNATVRITWLWSYLAVLLLPLIICALTLSFQNQELLSESAKANEAILTQIQVVYDDVFSKAIDFSQEVVLQTHLAETKTRAVSTYGIYQYRLYHLQQQINSLLAVNQHLEDYYVFFDNGTVLTSSAILSKGYVAASLEAKSFPYAQYLDLVKTQQQAAFVIMPWQNDEKIVYFTPFHDTIVGMPEGYVLLVFSNQSIAEMLALSSQWNEEGYMLIIDDQRQILASNRMPPQELIDQIDLGAHLAHNMVQSAGGSYIITSMPAFTPQLRYVSVLPSDFFYARYEFLHRLIVWTIIACVLLDGLMIYYCIRRNYRPIQQLISGLDDNTLPEMEALEGEYGQIRRHYSRLQTQNYEYLLLLERKSELLEQNFFFQWLTGSFFGAPHAKIHSIAAQYGVPLNQGDYLVGQITLPKEQPPFPDGLYLSIFQNLFSELFEPFGAAHYTQVYDLNLIVLFLNDPHQQAQAEIVCRQVGDILKEKFDVTASVTFSPLQNRLSDAPIAFMALSGKQIDVKYSYEFTAEDENRIANYLLIADTENLCSLIDSIFDKNLQQAGFPAQMAKCLAMDIGAAMMKSALSRDALINTGIVELLSRCDDAQAMRLALETYGRELCQHLRTQSPDPKQSPQTDLSDRVLAYCRAHFTEPDLNVNFLGDHFGRHPVYLSSQFRSRTGLRLSDFIRQLRIEHAKQLLLETSASIREIAADSGFTDSSALIRVFKTVEGITPSEYRQTHSRI